MNLSASAIESFKCCPTRFKLKYIDKIVPIESTDAQRIGTNWHKVLEVLSLEPESVCRDCAKLNHPVTTCPYCGGEGFLPKDTMDVAVRFLWDVYTIGGMLVDGREVEYYTLLNALAGYNWYWASQEQYKTIVREYKFEVPVRSMAGRALPNVKLRGMIDKIVQNDQGQYLVIEHKSTSKSIDSDSTIWPHFSMGVQSYLYPGTAQQLQADGELRDWGVTHKDPPIYGVLFDVFHKPQISPKKLTQKDSKEFVETGVYCGQEFMVVENRDEESLPCNNTDNTRELTEAELSEEPELLSITVNGVVVEFELGAEKKAKKGGTKPPRPFAIKETPEMFGARLLQDISERPEFYFARREVARTEGDFERFQHELLSMYQTIRLMRKHKSFFHNDSQCEATFRCQYLPICYANKNVEEEVPDGYKRV